MTSSATTYPPALVSQLSSLSGLPEEDVATQVLPYVTNELARNDSTTLAVKHYFETLLKPGQETNLFIEKFQNWLTTRKGGSLTKMTESVARTATSDSASPQHSQSGLMHTRATKKSTSSSTSKPTTTTRTTTRDVTNLQGEFGSSGKVYVKDRGTNSSRPSSNTASASNSRSQSPARPSSSVSTTVATLRPQSTAAATTLNNTNKGKSNQILLLDLTDEMSQQLFDIEHNLKLLEPGSKLAKRSCFCQARQHSLSRFSPMCHSCALVLCSLNSPISPCPSCQTIPISNNSTTLVNLKTNLLNEKNGLIEKEMKRIEIEKEKIKLNKASIKFPDLQDVDQVVQAREGVQSSLTSGTVGLKGHGYAQRLTGTNSFQFQKRIDQVYETGISLNGNYFGKKPNQQKHNNNNDSKVLRLDTKTKKVKLETRINKTKEILKSDLNQNQNSLDDDDDDGFESWIDQLDDVFSHSINVQAVKTKQNTNPERPFLNPQWTTVEWIEEPQVATIDESANINDESNSSTPVPTRHTDKVVPGSVKVVPGAGSSTTTPKKPKSKSNKRMT
ncbi:hypothetical protein OIO90_005300 [Microbotryomycetes sp. JL221]|nr:hypothetical protein OIO90_005300 [Microbotryomycetes sp. JL221]